MDNTNAETPKKTIKIVKNKFNFFQDHNAKMNFFIYINIICSIIFFILCIFYIKNSSLTVINWIGFILLLLITIVDPTGGIALLSLLVTIEQSIKNHSLTSNIIYISSFISLIVGKALIWYYGIIRK